MERPTPTSFDKVSVIGRGAYGKVCASSAPPPPPSLRAPPPSRAVGTNGQPYLDPILAISWRGCFVRSPLPTQVRHFSRSRSLALALLLFCGTSCCDIPLARPAPGR